MYKIVLLNSGGKDSLAAAMLLKGGKCARLGLSPSEPVEVHSLYVDLGWRNAALARAAAQQIADKYCASHLVIPVGGASWAHEFPGPSGGVRFQLVVLHSLGLMYAAAVGAQFLASGATHGPLDADRFPDAFNRLHGNYEKDFDEMVRQGALRHQGIRPILILPISALDKRGDEKVVWDLVKHEPLWRQTVTCNEAAPCGRCSKCQTRANWENRAKHEGF